MLALLLVIACGLQAASPPPGIAALASRTPLFEAEVVIAGMPPQTFRYGIGDNQGIRAFALTNERRPGLIAVIGGHGRVVGPGESAGLNLLFFMHVYPDGTSFIEGQLLNDAIQQPSGRLRASYRVRHRGVTVAAGEQVFADQTGVGFAGGEPRFVPRDALLRAYTATVPVPTQSVAALLDRSDAAPGANPYPLSEPTSVLSHNRYHCIGAVKFLFTRDRRYLLRLMDFVTFQAARPYHLSEVTGEPFLAARHPNCNIVDGRPELLPYRDTLGRDELPPGAEAEMAGRGWEGEHPDVEDLYAAYVLLGSRVARRELVLIAEQLMSTPAVRVEGYRQTSAGAFGWTARALLRAHQATGESRYVEAVTRMLVSLRKHRVAAGPWRALVPQQPDARHLADERWEASVGVAAAASALAMYCRARPGDAAALELLQFCGDLLVERAYAPELGGFFDGYSIDSDRRIGAGDAMDGAAMPIAAPLVELALFLPVDMREKYLKPARRIYEESVRRGPARITAQEFFRWFLTPSRELQ